jgi:hypothetical protein
MLCLGAKLTESSGLLSKVTKLVGKGNKDSSEQQADEKRDKEKEKEKGRSNLKHTKDDFVISGPTSKNKNIKKIYTWIVVAISIAFFFDPIRSDRMSMNTYTLQLFSSIMI